MKMRNAIISKEYQDPVFWYKLIWMFKIFEERGLDLKLVGDAHHIKFTFENGPFVLLLYEGNSCAKNEDYII